MKRLALSVLLLILLPISAWCSEDSVKSPNGGFELSGYLNTAVGYQHFSHDPVTERADDGSFGGPIGEWLPDVTNGTIPTPGHQYFQFFVPDVEIDIVKHFGDRARLRADLFFGRAASGSENIDLAMSHAYAAVTLSKKHRLELVLGRFGLPPGFEPYQAYFNDTVSWSIIWRGLVAPGAGTGIKLDWKATDHVELIVAATNGLVHDRIVKNNHLSTFISSLVLTWGKPSKQSSFALTPFVGPESGGNRPLTVGSDATLTWWVNDHWQLGLEAIYQRDDEVDGLGVDTSYIGGLVNIHWEPVPQWYGVLKYANTWQNAPGNGVLNLTGAEQFIHEMSVGMGYYIADGMKFKLEGRFDIIAPKHAATQWVAGAAMGFSCAY